MSLATHLNLKLCFVRSVATINAAYNYWGSTFCSEFVPLFLLEDMPDQNLTYLPFTDETHSDVYEACEGSAASPASWGRIKAMYR